LKNVYVPFVKGYFITANQALTIKYCVACEDLQVAKSKIRYFQISALCNIHVLLSGTMALNKKRVFSL
jgi:hypothetical protein